MLNFKETIRVKKRKSYDLSPASAAPDKKLTSLKSQRYTGKNIDCFRFKIFYHDQR